MSNQIQSGYMINDNGTVRMFDTKAAAQDFLRRPKILSALIKITGSDNKELADWLVENQEAVEVSFETGTIKRVTKAEYKKLKTCLDAIVASGDKAFSFVIDNAGAIYDSFRHPSVKRMTEEEKAVAARNSLVAACGNEEVAKWIIANKDAVLEAYSAGKEKREVSEKAASGLAEYRDMMNARKAQLEAVKDDAAAVASLKEKFAKEDEDRKAAKAAEAAKK